MTTRLLLAGVVGFAVSALAGRWVVPMLRAAKAGQSIKEDGPTWHMSKQGTPTMGGILFIFAILVALDWQGVLMGDFSALYVFGFALVFGLIGFLDDFSKLRRKQNTGLTAPMKFLLQLSVSVLFVVLMRYNGMLTPNLYIPFFHVSIHLPWVVYMIFAALVMVAAVNAVNLTDGVDGLAATVTLPVAAFFTVVAGVWGYASLGVFGAAMFGALVGFLMYNFYPAKVFMGDTGSLFLGGAICGLAFALDIPLVLALVGIVYVVETLSDIIQVAYFKATHGKRVFKMAPLHHHFEMSGWSEVKVVGVFSAVSLVFCVLTYFGVIDKVLH